MICTNCQHNNLASAVFCLNCGTRLPDHEGISSEPVREAQPFRAGPSVVDGDVVQLGPKPLGDLIGGAFAIYKKDFLPFFALAMLPQIPLIILAMAVPGFDLAALLGFTVEDGGEAAGFSQLGSLSGTVVVLIIAMVLLTILSMGGIIHATGQHCLGRTVEFLPALRAAGSKFVPLLLAGLFLTLIVIIPAILAVFLIGIPVLIFLMVRLYFAFNALMLEDLSPADSILRSWRLVEGCWWRTFGIGIVFVLLWFGANIGLLVLNLILGAVGIPILGELLSITLGIVIAPFLTIGATVVYLDLRVRKEGGAVKLSG